MARIGFKNLIEFTEAFYEARINTEKRKEWALILQMFNVHVSKGQMYVPETFYPKIQKWFGKIDDTSADDAVLRVENQVISKIAFLKNFYTVSDLQQKEHFSKNFHEKTPYNNNF